MSDRTPSPRRYSDEEIRAVLERAAEIQHVEASTPEGSGLTLAELESAAREAGIDVEAVRRAAAELEVRVDTGSAVAARVAGAPTRVTLVRSVPGERDVADLEALIPVIRDAVGASGTRRIVGHTLTWQAQVPNAARDLEVMVSSRDGETRVRVEEGYGVLVGGLFGGGVGGLGGGLGFGVGMGVGAAIGSPLMMVAFPVGAIGLAYLGSRAVYSGVVRRRRRALDRLLDDVVAVLEATRPALPPEQGPDAGRGEDPR
ncbi:MAG: hypothetical protein R3314_00800 [Longimicrobiales bacterium]|nr:hypothetical protein [Longimicrobiales bacterium]